MSIPLDCIGIIMEYVTDFKVLRNVTEVSKAVRYFIEHTRPSCCVNIRIFFHSNLPTHRKKYYTYVRMRDFRKEDPDKFKIFDTLIVFDMKYSFITDKQLSNFINLQWLSIEGVYNKNKIGKSFTRLKKLTVLYIDMRSTNVDLSYLGELESLVMVRIDNSPKINANILEPLRNLQYIDICGLTVTDNKSLINNKNIRTLIIKNISFNATEKIFKNMSKLEYLSINSSYNFTVTKKIFEYLPNIRVLKLEDINTLKDDDIKYIGKKLRRLHINYCDITDLGLSYINQELQLHLKNNTLITLKGIKRNKYLYKPKSDRKINVSFINKAHNNINPIYALINENKDIYNIYCDNLGL